MLLDLDDRRRLFESRVIPHRATIHEFALKLTAKLPNPDEIALEIVQECYLRALRYYTSFEGHDVVAWLRAIALNVFLTWRRRERSSKLMHFGMYKSPAEEFFDTLWCNESEDPEWSVIVRVDGGRLFVILGELPAALRQVIVLRDVEELSYSEIASSVGVPIGTVMSRLARARAALREKWSAKRAVRTKQIELGH